MDFDKVLLIRKILSHFVVLIEDLSSSKIKSFNVDFGHFAVVYHSDPEKGVKVYEENED